jgi:hypothetical protein
LVCGPQFENLWARQTTDEFYYSTVISVKNYSKLSRFKHTKFNLNVSCRNRIKNVHKDIVADSSKNVAA